MGARTIHLAVELSGAGRHPAAWRRLPDPAAVFTAGYHVGLVAAAARGDLDLVALADSFEPPGDDPAELAGSLDAVAVAARVAPVVGGIGLVPTVTVTHTEPFHVSKAIATLDFVSAGRAGWQPAVSRTPAEAELFGRKQAAPPAELWAEAAEAIEVVVRLWDSWEDDAVIRDVATGRYVDRDKLHYVDFVGEFFSVKGPSITPRSPQAHPLVVMRAAEPEELAVAARVGRRRPDRRPGPARGASRPRPRPRRRGGGRSRPGLGRRAARRRVPPRLRTPTPPAAASTRSTGSTRSSRAPCAWSVARARSPTSPSTPSRQDAADGVTAVPLALPGDLDALADGAAPLLATRRAAPAATLRERFGLARPANHFARGA